jgi:hypothetical protein
MVDHNIKSGKRPGYFVSTFTKLFFEKTRAAAEALQADLDARGLDRGLLMRECQCGCGQPAAKPVKGAL